MIQFTVAGASKRSTPSDAVVLLAHAGQDGFLNAPGKAGNVLRELLAKDGFEGKPNQAAFAHDPGGLRASRAVALGLGERPDRGPETFRRAGGRLARKARELRVEEASVEWPRSLDPERLKAFVEGLALGSYQYLRYKTQAQDAPKGLRRFVVRVPSDLLAGARSAVQKAQWYAEGALLARDLINGAPSDVTPKVLVDTARRIAGGPVRLKVFGRKELQRMGAGGILGVNRGSAQEPYLIHLHYRPKGPAKKSVALVGKGITFDSGGLSLKPAGSMETMKMDMSGAAAVLGTFSQLARLKPSVEVHGLIPTTENMPGGRAYKPGDVLTALNGKTMEVLNTDAEGRLILSDALAYAVQLKAGAIVDLATLTGACVVALGSLVAGALSNDAKLLDGVKEASEAEGEPLWELPLVAEYRDDIKSKVADIKNIGGAREAGTIIGGLFLEEFVGETPWVHLDIAGPAYLEREFPAVPYLTHGGTGLMVRTLLTFLGNR